MKSKLFLAAATAAVMLLAGCASTPSGVEKGPQGTIAYDVAIDASAPGARIEANGQYVGNTPIHIKIFGDKDGTFHDFGSYTYVVRALPLNTNQYAQVRVFGTGRHFTHEDYVPHEIYFDMNQPAPAPAVPDYGPPAYYGPGPYYYPPPYYYPGPYYGPSFRFYIGPHHW